VHFEPGPRRIGTASGLKMDISLGPKREIKSELAKAHIYKYSSDLPVRTKSPYCLCSLSNCMKLSDLGASFKTCQSLDVLAMKGPRNLLRR
jgi:hypothetical protein